MDLEASSRIGFMMNTDGGEWTPSDLEALPAGSVSRMLAWRTFDA